MSERGNLGATPTEDARSSAPREHDASERAPTHLERAESFFFLPQRQRRRMFANFATVATGGPRPNGGRPLSVLVAGALFVGGPPFVHISTCGVFGASPLRRQKDKESTQRNNIRIPTGTNRSTANHKETASSAAGPERHTPERTQTPHPKRSLRRR